MQFWAIIADSFRESRDRKIFWVMIGLSVLVAGAMACIGFDAGSITLFGRWNFEAPYFFDSNELRKDLVAAWLIDGVMDTILGFVGLILTIIATAGFIPTFLEKGVIDVVLAKPASRASLFLARYFGSLVFIFVQASVFIGLTLLVAGLRWKVWLPGYLYSIPLMVVLFSYFYCISALAGTFYRNSLAPILLTLGAWVVFFGIQTVDDVLDFGGFSAVVSAYEPGYKGLKESDWTKDGVVHKTIHLARWAIPKTQDITYKSRQWVKGASAAEMLPTEDPSEKAQMEFAELVEKKRQSIPAWKTIGSSLLFEAIIVLIAMIKFSRSDF